MLEKCDICGFEYESTAHFCGKCGVDLREPKTVDNVTIDTTPSQPIKKKPKSSSKNEDLKDDSIIKWCLISALCNSYQMTFPIFFNLVLSFADGKKHLGFCDCPSCNRGYRELLAYVTSGTEKKKLTASSREIVIKARETKIDGMKLIFPIFYLGKKLRVMINLNQNTNYQKRNRETPIKSLSKLILMFLKMRFLTFLKVKKDVF